jgi:hypothetical protein
MRRGSNLSENNSGRQPCILNLWHCIQFKHVQIWTRTHSVLFKITHFAFSWIIIAIFVYALLPTTLNKTPASIHNLHFPEPSLSSGLSAVNFWFWVNNYGTHVRCYKLHFLLSHVFTLKIMYMTVSELILCYASHKECLKLLI